MKQINYIDHPESDFGELLKKYSNMYLILDDVLASNNSYRIVYQDILDMLKYGFEYEIIRHKPIKFKIHENDKKMHSLPMNNFLSNMILWRSFVEMENCEVMSEEHIFDFKGASLNDIIEYIDSKVLPICNLDFKYKNKMIDDISYHMRCISTSFSMLMGMGISIYNIYKLEEQIPEITEIMYGKIDPSLQPIEIEKILKERTERLIELFTQTDNDLKPLFLSGKNLSNDQFKEIMIKIGLKADINGNTIPFLIDCNILVDGICKPSYAFLDNLSARKALVNSKTRMGEPGAFSKKMCNNTTTAVLRKDYEECNSQELVFYHIKNDKMLNLLDKRYYFDSKAGTLKLLNYYTDKHLIGKVLGFKSPATCSSKEGICHICYGELYEINKDLFSVGAFAATKESEPLGQRILSAKHSQVTASTLISWIGEFDKVFELSSNEITIKDSFEEDCYLLLDDVIVEDNGDEEFYHINEITILDDKGNPLYKIREESGINFFLSPELIKLYKASKGKPISLNDFDDSNILFYAEIKNTELSKPLEDLEKLLNNKEHLGCRTISEMCQKMLELKIDAGINYNAVHSEVIIRNLLRKKSNILEEPDFSPTGDHDDYQILRLDDALTKNPSPAISLVSNYLRKQLLSPSLYKKRKKSHLDSLLIPSIYNVRDED